MRRRTKPKSIQKRHRIASKPRGKFSLTTHRRSLVTSKPTKTASAPFEWVSFLLVTMLSFVGLRMIFDASMVDAFKQFSDQYYFVKLQSIWLLAGLAAAVVVYFIPLSFYRRLSPALLVTSLILLIIVLIPGVTPAIYGAKRWLFIGSFSLQPSEIVKLTLALYLPSLLAKNKSFKAYAFVIALIGFLVMLQPDLGTLLIIIASTSLSYILSGSPLKKFVLFFGLVLLLGVAFVFGSDYRRARVATFINADADPLGSSYHIRQILLSFGSGGILGTGLGQSKQKFQFLPEATTDSIFAVIGEELGLIGGLCVIGLYLALMVRGFTLIQKIPLLYPRLVAGTILSWWFAQSWLNIAAMVVIVPLTGIPLPFISYGGSALLLNCVSLGIYLNCLRYRV